MIYLKDCIFLITFEFFVNAGLTHVCKLYVEKGKGGSKGCTEKFFRSYLMWGLWKLENLSLLVMMRNKSS